MDHFEKKEIFDAADLYFDQCCGIHGFDENKYWSMLNEYFETEWKDKKIEERLYMLQELVDTAKQDYEAIQQDRKSFYEGE